MVVGIFSNYCLWSGPITPIPEVKTYLSAMVIDDYGDVVFRNPVPAQMPDPSIPVLGK
jgi:hypothetical protein